MLREARVYHTGQDPRCRLNKEASETVQHIMDSTWKIQAGTAYMEHYNQVGRGLGLGLQNICTEYGLEVQMSRVKVVENDRAKILWDFQIQTDKQVMANQPDIVVVDKMQTAVIDVVIPRRNMRSSKTQRAEGGS